MATLLGIIALIALAVGVALFLFYAVVHPIWGIIDCAASPAESPTVKVVWIVVMVFGWSVGSILYGLVSATKIFMTVTRVTLVAFLATAAMFFSMVLIFPAIWDRLPSAFTGKNREKTAALSTTPTTAPARESMQTIAAESAGLEPYTALYFVPVTDYRDAVSVAYFDEKGNLSSRIVPVIAENSNPPTRLAIDPQDRMIYALSAHDLGTIDATSGKFSLMPIDPNLPQLSWPGGIAFDLQRRRLMVADRSNFYALDIATGKWALVPSLKNVRLGGLAYSPLRNVLYGLVDAEASESIRQLLEMTSDGAILRSIRLSPPIPAAPFGGRNIQVVPNGAKLLVIVPAPRDRKQSPSSASEPDRRYLLNPSDGRVSQIQ